MRTVTVTLVVGIALIAAITAYTLTRSPPRVVRVNSNNEAVLDLIDRGLGLCQPGETLPADVTALRLSLWAFVGYDVHVRLYRGTQLLTEGHRGADWTSDSVTVPVKPLSYPSSEVTLCVAIGPDSEPGIVLGAQTHGQQSAVFLTGETPTPADETTESVGGKVDVEYLTSGRVSWWSGLYSVAQHMGLGRAFSGTWITWLIAALIAVTGFLALRLTLREVP
jgi:hypothetical protein